MKVKFLFRKPKPNGHVFITTEDPGYRYDTLCGHCDFPIEADDEHCPRCRKTLEDCAVCRHRTHRRSPVEHPQHKPQITFCPVCHTTRHPIGASATSSLEGTFCTNLYGCPAGGLLLASDEIAVLPQNASLCPVCRHEKLPPLAIVGFHYLLRRCLFCSTLFGLGSTGARGWAREPVTQPSPDWLSNDSSQCSLCGRNDHVRESKNGAPPRVVSESISERQQVVAPEPRDGLVVPAYLRMVELARALALESDNDKKAFTGIMRLWFDSTGEEPSETGGIKVRQLVAVLIQGTLNDEIRALLQGRLERFEDFWQRQLGIGLDYRVSFLSSAERDAD